MVVRTDVTVDWSVSPRIFEVASPSTELTIQDLLDTCRVLEDDLTPGMSEPRLIDAAGKDPLEGGLFVGVTAALQDTQIAFEARDTEVESGTVTTGGTIIFTDTAADFTAAGVVRGSSLINYTDGSVADVREVLSSTQLETTALTGGTSDDWVVSDVYGVFNVIQCVISGGNLVAVDANDSAIDPVLPTFSTQVVRVGSSSATLIQSSEITDIQTRVVLIEKLQRNRLETNPTTGIMTLYDDDSVTPLFTTNIYEDVAASQPYQGTGAERRNRLT